MIRHLAPLSIARLAISICFLLASMATAGAQTISRLQSLSLSHGQLSPSFSSTTSDYSFELSPSATSTTLSLVPSPGFTGEVAFVVNGTHGGLLPAAELRDIEIPITTDLTHLRITVAQTLVDARIYHVFVRRPYVDQQSSVLRDIAAPTVVRASAKATALSDGRVIIAGGATPLGQVSRKVEIYDPVTDHWTVDPSDYGMYYGIQQPLADGRTLFAGGFRTSTENPSVAEWGVSRVFAPASNTWEETGAMGQTRYAASSVALNDGRILVVGGAYIAPGSSQQTLSAPEIFDPVTESWSPANAPDGGRILTTLTRLPDGKVLMTGGTGATGAPLSTASIYDPATGLWTTAASMTKPRWSHAATLLADGRVLVSGGVGVSNPELTSEIYDPATGIWSQLIPFAFPMQAVIQNSLPNGKAVLTGAPASGGPNDSYIQIFDPKTETWSTGPTDSPLASPPTATLLSGNRIVITSWRDPAVGSGNPNKIPVAKIFQLFAAGIRIEDGATTITANGVLDMGNSPIGVSRSKTLTLTNTGDSPVTLRTAEVAFGVPGEFTASGPGVTTLAAGASTTVTVTFTPTGGETRTATLYLGTKLPDDSSIVIPILLEGSGPTFSSYSEWAAAAGYVGPSSGPEEVYRADGVKNVLKYAFKMATDTPDVGVMTAGGGSGLPLISFIPGSPWKVRYEYVRRKNGNIVYTPQIAASLGDFTSVTAPQTITSLDAAWERVVVEQDVTSPKAFARVKVVEP